MWWRTLRMVSLFKAQLVIDWNHADYNMENNPLYEMRRKQNPQYSVARLQSRVHTVHELNTAIQ